MPGIVQELEIGRYRYVFGMDWYILEVENQRQQIDDIADRQQTRIGVRTGNPKTHPGVGFLTGMKKAGAVSAAATIAKHVDHTILVQPLKLFGGPDNLYWMVAVQDRRIVPGTDIVGPEHEITPLVRRYSVLGDFKLVGEEEFFEKHFRELRTGHEFFPQNAATIEHMLVRGPVRLKALAHQTKRQVFSVGLALAVVAIAVMTAVWWKQRQATQALQPVEQPTSAEMWRAQLPIVRAQMIKQFEETLGPVTPGRFVNVAMDRIGEISPLQDDWYLSEVSCNTTSCNTTWVNNGLSDNMTLWASLRGEGDMTFEPTGTSANLVFPLEVEADRREISSVEIAALPPQQRWLREQGSRLQQLASVGLRVSLMPPKPSQQFMPSPDGAELIGPDTTFQFGSYKVSGEHYFMIRDAVKRLSDDLFSVSNLRIRFNEDQETTGWTLEGNYVWK